MRTRARTLPRQGIEKTGLGTRIAELLVRSFGGSTRSLGVSLAVGELLMTPGMPSTTARAAGVFVPVIRSVSAAGGSYPTGAMSEVVVLVGWGGAGGRGARGEPPTHSRAQR